MMICPVETYYKEKLEGKTKEEIWKEIKALKHEINVLKEEEEKNPDIKDFVVPDNPTRVKYDRQYLARAIQAYEEAGGKYEYTAAERKSRDFDRDLQYLFKMVLAIKDVEMVTYSVTGDEVEVEYTRTPRDSKHVTEIYTASKEDFVAGLTELHIGEWKREYENPYVPDNVTWDLAMFFDCPRRPVMLSGHNAYPYNFEELTRLLKKH